MNVNEKALEEIVPRILDRLALMDIHDLEEAENMAHEILTAAAPYIQAQALREHAGEVVAHHVNASPAFFEGMKFASLQATNRADELEAGSD